MSKRKLRMLAATVGVLVAQTAWVTPLPQALAVPRGANGDIVFTGYDYTGAHIWAMHADGSSPRKISFWGPEDHNPEVSPDGRSVVFDSSFDGGGIWKIATDGSRRVRLTDNRGEFQRDVGPSWSPDGRHILYTKAGNPSGSRIYIMTANGQNQRPLRTGLFGSGARYTPDGLHIVFMDFISGTQNQYPQIFIVNADGSQRRRVTNNEWADSSPVVSPDGRRVAFYRAVDGNHWHIYVMNLDGTHAIQLTDDPSPDLRPTWSPDGERILFVRDTLEMSKLWIMNADGSNQHALPAVGTDDIAPSWGTIPSTCLNHPVTIRGTEGPDILRGTPGRDVISGRGGNDVIKGLGGNDVLCGGPGADLLVGGTGADQLNGGIGHDRLRYGN